jgi:hypothetical protein
MRRTPRDTHGNRINTGANALSQICAKGTAAQKMVIQTQLLRLVFCTGNAQATE